jgi:hypothetical protein
MIAVQMAYQNKIDFGGIDGGAFERREQSRPGFHQNLGAAGFDSIARLKAPAARKRIPGPQHSYAQVTHEGKEYLIRLGIRYGIIRLNQKQHS